MKFLQSHELTDDQEVFLEEVTDFFVQNLEELEVDSKFFKKAELAPLQLPVVTERKKRKAKL